MSRGPALYVRQAQEQLEEAVFKAIAHRLHTEGSLSAQQVSDLLEQEVSRFLGGLPPEVREAMPAQMLKERCSRLVHQVFGRIEARMAEG